MNDIWINNEKIMLKNLKYLRGVTTVELKRDLKRTLRYQKLFLIGPGNDYITVDLSGKVGNISVSPNYDEAYVIVRTGIMKEVVYEESDIRIIKCIIHHFSGIKPEITEKFCKAIGYNILSDYHGAYGLKGLGEFRSVLFKKDPIKVGRPEVLCYGRPRYSIVSLVSDFLEVSDLQIFTDPELIGRYKRISRKMIDGSTVLHDKWAKFMGVSGNRTRANISINTLSRVGVEIPENDKGVESGRVELDAIRSFTLVVDGKLNMEELGFKTSDTKLIGKLKRLGVIEPMLFEGEYVVNLTKLPIFSKRPPLPSSRLAYSEFKVRESEVKARYVSLLLYRQERKLKELPRKIKEPEEEKSERIKFLESLGIFGSMYYPEKTKTGSSTSSYQTLEVIGKVSGIPSDLYPNLRNYINTGSCKNAVIMEALKDLAGLRNESDPEKLKDELRKVENEKKKWVKDLRSLKFRMITGKTLTFSDKQLEDAKVRVKEGVSVSWVVKDTVIEV